jgi:hypothetical protein
MSAKHLNEPRDLAYGKDHIEQYQGIAGIKAWTAKDSNSIFNGKRYKDLFIFAMALGRSRKQKSEVKGRVPNIPVNSLTEQQKWAILSIALTDQNDLMCLKDEEPMYKEAERYAEEGLKILKSHVDKWGSNYPKYLEAELKEILKNSESDIK